MIDVSTLKGKALAEKAKELDIKNRSKLSAADLRHAIANVLAVQVMESELNDFDHKQREAAYRKQNGTNKLTAKQAKRLRKKARREGVVI